MKCSIFMGYDWKWNAKEVTEMCNAKDVLMKTKCKGWKRNN